MGQVADEAMGLICQSQDLEAPQDHSVMNRSWSHLHLLLSLSLKGGDHLLKWMPYSSVNFLISEHVREPTENCAAVSLLSTEKLWIPLTFCWKFTEEMLFHSPNL